MRTFCTVFSNLKLFPNKRFYFLKREFSRMRRVRPREKKEDGEIKLMAMMIMMRWLKIKLVAVWVFLLKALTALYTSHFFF